MYILIYTYVYIYIRESIYIRAVKFDFPNIHFLVKQEYITSISLIHVRKDTHIYKILSQHTHTFYVIHQVEWLFCTLLYMYGNLADCSLYSTIFIRKPRETSEWHDV